MAHRPILGAVLALALTTGCRSDRGAPAADTPPAAQPPAATPAAFTASEYQFDGPDQLPAGLTEFTLENQGKEPHHLVVVRLEGGRTYDSLVAALKQPGPPPPWVHPVGGPNGISAGVSANAQLVLEPGEYAVICFVPTVEGVPHFARGMVRRLEVTPAAGPAADETPADVVVKLTDYTYSSSKPLTPGRHVFRVENDGQQLHELVVARLEPGSTAKDLAAWELGGRKGPAQWTYLGGAAPMAPGDHNQFTMSLEPGEYAYICFVPDAKDGKPHLQHGMLQQIKVE